MKIKPNILYLHSHDAGRVIGPLGAPVSTPHLDALARRGCCFRNSHTVAPTCSPSRAALLTGQYPHQNGMFGLAHFGFRLKDPKRHPAQRLHEAGYVTALAGVQHITEKPEEIGYDELLPRGNDPEEIEPGVDAFLSRRKHTHEPFFLSVGLSPPHRRDTRFPFNPELDKVDSRYVAPMGGLPDTPDIREDIAEFLSSVRYMDRGFGMVLDALERHGLSGDTLVICTTDHGPPFPDMKCNLRADGTGVFLIVAGPGVQKGIVQDALTANIDIYPTLLEAAGLQAEPPCEGKSLWPLLRGETLSVREEVYSEVNYHVSYEPMRSLRTQEWNYIRRFPNGHPGRVLPNCDTGLSRKQMVSRGWLDTFPPTEELYDLRGDPGEKHNLAESTVCQVVLQELRRRLESWMQRTDDALLEGAIPAVRPELHPPPHDTYYPKKA